MSYGPKSSSEQEQSLSLPALENPTLYDLQKNAEAGIVKRALARYLITGNYERSIKWHEKLGTSYIRKIVMGTIGKRLTSGNGRNYFLDSRMSRIDSTATFAFESSVFNEAVHSIVALPHCVLAANAVIESGDGAYAAANAVLVAGNIALVALQRYNRARLIRSIDKQLSTGATFSSNYENWLGIDHRAAENYENTLPRSEQATMMTQDLSVGRTQSLPSTVQLF